MKKWLCGIILVLLFAVDLLCIIGGGTVPLRILAGLSFFAAQLAVCFLTEKRLAKFAPLLFNIPLIVYFIIAMLTASGRESFGAAFFGGLLALIQIPAMLGSGLAWGAYFALKSRGKTPQRYFIIAAFCLPLLFVCAFSVYKNMSYQSALQEISPENVYVQIKIIGNGFYQVTDDAAKKEILDYLRSARYMTVDMFNLHTTLEHDGYWVRISDGSDYHFYNEISADGPGYVETSYLGRHDLRFINTSEFRSLLLSAIEDGEVIAKYGSP